MEEVFFTDEWYRKSSAALNNASGWLSGMVKIVPPALFFNLDKVCRYHNVCRGSFPRDSAGKPSIMKWSLSANIMAPGFSRFASIGILTSEECEALFIDTPRSFTVSFHIQLDYNLGFEPKTEILTSFTPGIINRLRIITFLNDSALQTVLGDAIEALPTFNGKVMDWVKSQLPDRNAQFVFDKAIRCLCDLRVAHDNNWHAANFRTDAEKKLNEFYKLSRDAAKSLADTAKRIEQTKSFSKSRVLEKIRKDAENEATAVWAKADEIYSGEYYGTIGG